MHDRSVTESPRPARSDATRQVMAIVAGLTVLVAGMVVVRDGSVPGPEESVFRAVNGLPGWLYPVIWPFQQLGVLLLGPALAVVALVLRRYRLAIAALLVTVAKLVSERLVKASVSRQRPGTSIGSDVELRGDVHLAGESFVSGHALLVAALAGVITPYLPGRWKFVPWALVGAVLFGRVYVGAHNPLDVVCGAALGIAIAGVVNLVVGVGHRRPARDANGPEPADHPPAHIGSRRTGTARIRVVAVVCGAATAGLVGCTSDPNDSAPRPSLTDDVITVGSFDFAESVVVAEVYSQGLEAAGYEVERAFSLGPREFVGPALVDGLVEFVPEYAGTASEFHSLGRAEPTDDVDATHGELERALAGRPVTVLAAAPAQDANTFVVTQATARRFDLDAVSDLATVGGELVFGGPAECPARRLCLAGLADVYGTHFAEFVALDAGGPLTRQALQEGDVDIALMFTTDPSIQEMDLVELVDDRGLQPAENITPLVRTEVVERWGDDVVGAIDSVSSRLTTQTVRELNRTVASSDVGIPAIVAAWWSEEHS